MTHTLTVEDAMLRHPTLHPGDISVGAARAVFDTSPKTHLLLLVSDGVLVSTLTRRDLEADADVSSPAARLGSLDGRTVGPEAALAPTHEAMLAQGQRRFAVVDSSMRLLGLLCLKRKLTGFCTDEGVARMRAARRNDPEFFGDQRRVEGRRT